MVGDTHLWSQHTGAWCRSNSRPAWATNKDLVSKTFNCSFNGAKTIQSGRNNLFNKWTAILTYKQTKKNKTPSININVNSKWPNYKIKELTVKAKPVKYQSLSPWTRQCVHRWEGKLSKLSCIQKASSLTGEGGGGGGRKRETGTSYVWSDEHQPQGALLGPPI